MCENIRVPPWEYITGWRSVVKVDKSRARSSKVYFLVCKHHAGSDIVALLQSALAGCHVAVGTVNSEIFARNLHSRIVLLDIFAM